MLQILSSDTNIHKYTRVVQRGKGECKNIIKEEGYVKRYSVKAVHGFRHKSLKPYDCFVLGKDGVSINKKGVWKTVEKFE